MHCIEYSNIKTPVVVVVVCDILELYRIRSPLQVYLGPNLIRTRMQPDDSPVLVPQRHLHLHHLPPIYTLSALPDTILTHCIGSKKEQG
jgi:hypothetical protein